jgi:glucosamine--fructose-6-phosphate aminotransferase (isomerizing)
MVSTYFRLDADWSQRDSTLVVSISQSGATAEIVEMVSWAKRMGARTLAITNVENSPLSKVADLGLTTQAGKEEAIPATKSYLTALGVLTYVVGCISDDELMIAELQGLPAILKKILGASGAYEAAASIFKGSETAVIAGRGFTLGTAKEVAIKIKETSSINTIGSSVADLIHGPIAAFVSDLPVVCIAPSAESPVMKGIVDVANRAKSAGCGLITIGGLQDLANVGGIHFPLPKVAEHLAPFTAIMVGQILAEKIAWISGHNPDKPKGLNKVTQTIN